MSFIATGPSGDKARVRFPSKARQRFSPLIQKQEHFGIHAVRLLGMHQARDQQPLAEQSARHAFMTILSYALSLTFQFVENVFLDLMVEAS